MSDYNVDIVIAAKNLASGALKKVGSATKKLASGIKKAGIAAAKTAMKVGSLATKVAALGAAGVAMAGAFVLKGAIGEFAAFEKALANVSTLGNYGKETMKQFQDGIMKLPSALGSATELTKGLYQTLSAGVKPTKALEFLKKAATAAKAGLTDTFTAVDAGSTILNAFGKDTEEAGKIFDLMFTTVKEGKTTFEELAGAVGKISPIASAAGVSVEEMHAAIATLTKGGFATSEASARLATGLGAIVKPSSEAKEMAEALNLEFNATALAAKGLHGFLRDVKFATGGNIEKMAQLFGGMESLSVMLALTGEQSKEFTAILHNMKDASGATDEAFGKQKVTLSSLWETFKNTIGKQAILIGEKLAPEIKDVIEKTEAWMVKNRNLVTKEVGDWIKGIFGFIKDLKPAFDNVIEKVGKWYDVNKDVMKMEFVDYLKNAATAVVEISKKIDYALKPLGLLAKGFQKVGEWIGTTAGKIADFIDKLKKIPKKVGVNFTGKGSTETMLSEKIAEMRGKFGSFAGYVSGLKPKFNIDATAATGALGNIQELYRDLYSQQLSRVALAAQNYGTHGVATDIYSAWGKRQAQNQLAGAQAGLDFLRREMAKDEALFSGGHVESSETGSGGGGVSVGELHIHVEGGPQDAQYWREVTREHIIPELEALN